jgi:hypothetical protein
MYYGFTRAALLELRETLLTLPPHADDAERWVKKFTKTLVRSEYLPLPACILNYVDCSLAPYWRRPDERIGRSRNLRTPRGRPHSAPSVRDHRVD